MENFLFRNTYIIYIYTHTHSHTHLCTYLYIYRCVYAYYACIFICTYVCVCIDTNVKCTWVHMPLHRRTHTHVRTCMNAEASPPRGAGMRPPGGSRHRGEDGSAGLCRAPHRGRARRRGTGHKDGGAVRFQQVFVFIRTLLAGFVEYSGKAGENLG